MGLQNGKIAALPFVTADLNYLTPSANRPRNYTFEPPSGEPKSNIVPEPHGLPIHDVRPISDAVSLDREGFALVQQISAVRDFYNEDQVKRVYYPEAERLIKAATGADRVFVFDQQNCLGAMMNVVCISSGLRRADRYDLLWKNNRECAAD